MREMQNFTAETQRTQRKAKNLLSFSFLCDLCVSAVKK